MGKTLRHKEKKRDELTGIFHLQTWRCFCLSDKRAVEIGFPFMVMALNWSSANLQREIYNKVVYERMGLLSGRPLPIPTASILWKK